MKSQIRNRAMEIISIASERYNLDLTGITLKFDLRGKSMGQMRAVITPKRVPGAITLRFNLQGAQADPDHMLNDTVPHEIAHAVAYLLGEDNGHGAGWKMVCKALGGSGDRCHKVAVKSAQREWLYVASCGTEVKLTTVRHNRLQRKGGHLVLKTTKGKIAAEHYVRPA